MATALLLLPGIFLAVVFVVRSIVVRIARQERAAVSCQLDSNIKAARQTGIRSSRSRNTRRGLEVAGGTEG